MVDPAEDRVGSFGTFSMVSFDLLQLDGEDCATPVTMICVVPRGNRAEFAGLRRGDTFAGLYNGKYTPKGKTITAHDLTVRRI